MTVTFRGTPSPAELNRKLNQLAAEIGAAGGGSVTSVTGAGTVSGLTLTGTVTTTGDLTLGGTLSVATAAIQDGAVTLAKQANMATASVVYRKTAGAGAPEVQTLATLKTDLGLSGTNTGDQTSVSGNAGTATALATGRTLGITGDIVWTSPSFDGTANVTAAGTIQAGVVTLAKMADMATASLIYRKTAGSGTPEVQTLATLKTDLGLTGTNSGDQTSIVGITGTKAQFDTAVTDGNILYAGDVTQYTDELAQDAVGAMVDTTLTYVDGTPLLQRAALTGAITASAGSNATALGSFTLSQLNTALSDADVATGGGTATGTNTGDQTSIVGITGTLAQFDTAVTDANLLSVAAAAAAYQPLDAQLTSLAGLNYASNSLKFIRVNAGGTDFELVTVAGGGDVTGDDTSTTAQNIVAYSGTGGKNITELTGTQGDILYHNGTSWAKLGAGTVGQYLKTGGAGANPSWGYGAIIHSSKSAGATTTGADTTPVSVSGAVFDYVANAVYQIWVMGRLNSTAATTGAAIQFDLSSAVTAIDVQATHAITASGGVNASHSIADDTSAGVTSSVPAGPLDVPIVADGLLVTGVNAGTCQLRLRSETTAVTELMAGTVMVVCRVA